uniref:Secreted protein n=1 Tax=Steinernema glaseri TaxID=37863 RepID=A0A1I7ZVE0_9BILA
MWRVFLVWLPKICTAVVLGHREEKHFNGSKASQEAQLRIPFPAKWILCLWFGNDAQGSSLMDRGKTQQDRSE